MKVSFTTTAAHQVRDALDYVAAQSPQGAASLRRRLLDVLALIGDHPAAGRMTQRRGVRRVVLTPYPYLLDYRASEQEILVLRFRHGARRPI